jgi:alginate O-acetyltransferase complex protein AlgI
MSFASNQFLFLFLPIVLVLFYLLPFRNWRNSILVLASLIFFAWTDPTHIPQLIVFVLVNYFFGIVIGHFIHVGKPKASQTLMWVAVILNLLGLCFYKYLGLFGNTIESIVQVKLSLPKLTLPIGISYLTFSSISYILDIYNEVETPEKNLLSFSAFLIMFPKLLQGPITRFGQVKNELTNTQRLNVDQLMKGARRFIIGLAKKVLLADTMGVVANRVFGASLSSIGAGLAWYGLIAYTLQIYFDFSGYTDMAIGVGIMLGFKLPENFNYPYISRSITDFWRRWHMTLTSWFRNYLFIPLEFARKKEKFLRQQTDILIVFLLTGLWHGASWNFVVWGGYFGLILAIEASGFGKKLAKTPIFFQHLYSIILIMVGWIFFRLTNFQNWGPFFKALFGGNGWTGQSSLRTLNILFYIPVMVIAAILCLPILPKLESKINVKANYQRVLMDLGYLVLFVIVICYLLSNGFTTFIYAQF